MILYELLISHCICLRVIYKSKQAKALYTEHIVYVLWRYTQVTVVNVIQGKNQINENSARLLSFVPTLLIDEGSFRLETILATGPSHVLSPEPKV